MFHKYLIFCPLENWRHFLNYTLHPKIQCIKSCQLRSVPQFPYFSFYCDCPPLSLLLPLRLFFFFFLFFLRYYMCHWEVPQRPFFLCPLLLIYSYTTLRITLPKGKCGYFSFSSLFLLAEFQFPEYIQACLFHSRLPCPTNRNLWICEQQAQMLPFPSFSSRNSHVYSILLHVGMFIMLERGVSLPSFLFEERECTLYTLDFYSIIS